MTTAGQNAFGIVAALVAGYIALIVAIIADFGGGELTYSSGFGHVLALLRVTWPFLAAAVMLGWVAGTIVNAPQRRYWPFVAGLLAVALQASTFRYIAPDWRSWATTLVAMAFVAAAGGGAFLLGAHDR